MVKRRRSGMIGGYSTLSSLKSALFSLCVKPDILVATALQEPLDSQFRSRLSRFAMEEKMILQDCIAHASLSSELDLRLLDHSSSITYHTCEAYQYLQADNCQDSDAMGIWTTAQIFWMVAPPWPSQLQGLSVPKKHQAQRGVNVRAVYRGPWNNKPHILWMSWRYWTLDKGWHHWGFHPTQTSLAHWHCLPLPQEVHLDVIMLILRQIWKAHNALTFDKRTTTTREVLQQVLDNLNSWQGCYKKQKTPLRAWREYWQRCL